MRLVAALFLAAAAMATTVATCGPAAAQYRKDLQPLPEPPPFPAADAAEPVPVVTVRQSGNDTVEEYRVAGRVVAIRVTPSHGVPYILTDPLGDGTFSNRRDSPGTTPVVPMWVLFTF